MEANMSVESRLSSIRQLRNIAAADLARRVGVSRQTIYAIESGSYVPNTAVALRLARELETPVEELFTLAESSGSAAETVTATVLSAAPAASGRPVRLAKVRNQWICAPADTLPCYLPEADGIVTQTRRGPLEARVQVFGAAEAMNKRLVVAGCDPAIGLLIRMAERLSGLEMVAVPASSRRAIQWLKQGKVHIAGSHLEDPRSGEFNLPYLSKVMPNEDLAVVTFARWEEGFVVRRGNPLGIRGAGDLAQPKLRLVNRERGSGSRALLDLLLRQAGVPPGRVRGYQNLAAGHLPAAYLVALGEADCCVATPSAARAFGLDFVPLRAERFDFAIRREFLDLPAVRSLLDILQRAALRRKLQSLAGYDTSQTGRTVV
jgi:molybdate-binding protein/DNA-binding XRE family transcriptional regulator